MKRRANGKGNAVFLGANREKQWGARITLGMSEDGKQIRHILGLFKTELEALIFLEEYHKHPTPIYLKKAKYDKIYLFSNNEYPLLPVDNPKLEKYKVKRNYTFEDVYQEFIKIKFLTDEEMILAKEKNIKIKGKYSYHYTKQVRAVHKYTQPIQNIKYRDLYKQDFQKIIDDVNKKNKGGGSSSFLLKLFRNLDRYALQEGIIDKGYVQFVNNDTAKIKKIQKSVFSYEQIQKLEKSDVTEKEKIIKDIILIALYTGCRIGEILYLKNENIFLDKGYFVTGSKTKAGINREIPIHREIRCIIKNYYNKDNEFLLNNNEKPYLYNFFAHKFYDFKRKYNFLENRTIHECRHTFRTELERLNVKQVIINSILGHKNENTGLDVYTHISLEEKKIAVNMINYKNNKLIVLKTS